MPSQKLKELLDKNKVRYTVMHHSPAYTAQEVAASAHVPGRELAKAVVVKLDGKMAMAVVPASYRVNLKKLADATRCREAVLATEPEMNDLFESCEQGAIPPFGNLWGLPVYASKSLAEDEAIAFNAGSHTEVYMLPFQVFQALAEPKILEFSEPLHSSFRRRPPVL